MITGGRRGGAGGYAGGQRRRRWSNIKTSLFQRVLFVVPGGGQLNAQI